MQQGRTATKAAGLIVFLLAIMILGGCGSGGKAKWTTAKSDFLSLPGDLVRDANDWITTPENQILLLVGGGASGYVRCAQDDGIAHHFEGRNTFPRDFTIAAGAAGSPVTHFTMAGAAYLYSLLAEDDQTRSLSRSMLEALSLTGIVTVGLKAAAQDHSPNGEFLAWPSGHTSSSVTVATVMNEYYGPGVGLPLYALSGLVMYERMDTDEHWASDIIFGAAIGYTVGKTVAAKRKPEIFGMTLLPYINPESGSTGLVFTKEF